MDEFASNHAHMTCKEEVGFFAGWLVGFFWGVCFGFKDIRP